jgi:hypothetical protein
MDSGAMTVNDDHLAGFMNVDLSRSNPMFPSNLPRYWDQISREDQGEYMNLRRELAAPQFSNQRGRSTEQFGTVLEKIKSYVVRGNKSDLNRALVCGIIWMPRVLAVNIRQMELLTSKCKSSINGSLSSLGYGTISCAAATSGELLATFPWMKEDHNELKRWTLRQPLGPNQRGRVIVDLQWNP